MAKRFLSAWNDVVSKTALYERFAIKSENQAKTAAGFSKKFSIPLTRDAAWPVPRGTMNSLKEIT